MSYRPINSFKDGEEVAQIFLLADVRRGTTKIGKPYGNITLKDKSGQISVKIWDFDPSNYPDFKSGAYVNLAIVIETFKGSLQAKAKSAPMIVATPSDPSPYESQRTLSPDKAEAFYKELMKFKDQVENKYIKTYLDVIFDNKQIKSLFMTAPASVSNRGAYRGGLIEHVYKVMLNAEAIVRSQKFADQPAPIDIDVVIAGVLTHDLGKMYSYRVDATGASMTRSGRLLNHLPLSYAISVQSFIQAESLLRKAIPEEIKDHINHCILAHHGQLEYGSPVKPQSIEAQIVHVADMADSTSSNFAEPILDRLDNIDSDGFVDGSWFASKKIYVGDKQKDD